MPSRAPALPVPDTPDARREAERQRLEALASEYTSQRPAPTPEDDLEPIPTVKVEPDLAPGYEVWEDGGFIVGLDLGERADPSASVVLQRVLRTEYVNRDGVSVDHAEFEIEMYRDHLTYEELGITPSRFAAYALREVMRWPLMTPYPTIVGETLAVLRRGELAGRPVKGGRPDPVLVVDAGGAAGVIDLFKERGLTRTGWEAGNGAPGSSRGGAALVPMLITTGFHPRWDQGRQLVPKAELVSAVGVALETRRLRWPEQGLPLLPTLIEELQQFRLRRSAATGAETWAAREGAHDDLVLALAIALWWGNRLGRDVIGEYKIALINTYA
jgi:hypothetical protein